MQFPCPFNIYVIDAEFSPDFVREGTKIWLVFNFLGSSNSLSTPACEFSPCTLFNCSASTVIPKPKKGSAYLLTTVNCLSEDGKEIKPIGRSRVNVETFVADWRTRNSYEVPCAADQKKILCKVHIVCSFNASFQQMCVQEASISESISATVRLPDSGLQTASNDLVIQDDNYGYNAPLHYQNPYSSQEPETSQNDHKETLDPYKSASSYNPYSTSSKNDGIIRRRGTPEDQNINSIL